MCNSANNNKQSNLVRIESKMLQFLTTKPYKCLFIQSYLSIYLYSCILVQVCIIHKVYEYVLWYSDIYKSIKLKLVTNHSIFTFNLKKIDITLKIQKQEKRQRKHKQSQSCKLGNNISKQWNLLLCMWWSYWSSTNRAIEIQKTKLNMQSI